MPEGTVVCNVEGQPGDRGVFARSSGNYATIISHNTDDGVTRYARVLCWPLSLR